MTPLRVLRRVHRLARRLWRMRVGTALTVAALGLLCAGAEWGLEPFDLEATSGTLTTPTGQPASTTAVITRWRDADTFESTAGPIRLENVEAPEAEPHDWKCDDPQLAADALDHALALAPVGSTVTLRYEGRMSWDRHIAWATLPDGRDLGEALYATGTVATYPNPSGACPGGDR